MKVKSSLCRNIYSEAQDGGEGHVGSLRSCCTFVRAQLLWLPSDVLSKSVSKLRLPVIQVTARVGAHSRDQLTSEVAGKPAKRVGTAVPWCRTRPSRAQAHVPSQRSRRRCRLVLSHRRTRAERRAVTHPASAPPPPARAAVSLSPRADAGWAHGQSVGTLMGSIQPRRLLTFRSSSMICDSVLLSLTTKKHKWQSSVGQDVLPPHSGPKEQERHTREACVAHDHSEPWAARGARHFHPSHHGAGALRFAAGKDGPRRGSSLFAVAIRADDDRTSLCHTLFMTAAETFIDTGQTTWCAMHGSIRPGTREIEQLVLDHPFLFFSMQEGTESHSQTFQNLSCLKGNDVLRTLPGAECSKSLELCTPVPQCTISTGLTPEGVNSLTLGKDGEAGTLLFKWANKMVHGDVQEKTSRNPIALSLSYSSKLSILVMYMTR